MLLFLSILGILLSVILLVSNAKNYRSSIYLGGFFFLISMYSLTQYVLFYSKSNFLIGVFFINAGFLAYLIGPMLYWYVRCVLTDNHCFSVKDVWHFLPMVIFLTATLPHIILPWSEKMEIAAKIIDDPAFITEYSGTLLYGMLPGIVVYLSRPILVLGYILWSAGLFARYTKSSSEKPVLSSQLFMKKWLYVLLGSLFILVFSHILLMVETWIRGNMSLFLTLNILKVLSGAGLIGLLVSPFFFPSILYGLPVLPKENLTEITTIEENFSHVEIIKQAHDFESEYLVSIGLKADTFMNEFKPYLQPDFNMNQLSALTHIPVHHLAFYFREIKKEHFIEYRNKLRIEHAKALIKNGKTNGVTLEAIGILSGFTSRNTFFKAFKKVEGISPGSFASRLN